MQVDRIFSQISRKMLADFEISADFEHHGNRGDFREDSLKEFLNNGQLPKQYAIGNGEIISSYNEVSKQTDLIMYDALKSITFTSSATMQIYPIESIYGVIEVKSKLNKQKLIEGLDNIKSIKSMYVPTTINKYLGPNTVMNHPTNPPFGIIFAYSLGRNSLDSLRNNVVEWCKDNDPRAWPNLICVLNEGIIEFNNGLDGLALNSIEIKSTSTCTALHYKEESLFQFTSRLIQLCRNREIDIFDISTYKEIGLIIDNNLRVKRHRGFLNRETGKNLRLKDDFIKEVYNECTEAIPYSKLIEKQCGKNQHITELFKNRTNPVYLYNPKNYPSMEEVIQQNQNTEKTIFEILQEIPNISSGHNLYINDNFYFVPYFYIFEGDNLQPE